MPAIRAFKLLLLLFVVVINANAENSAGIPGREVDAQTLRVQRKVEELIEQGKFERAYFIYRHELTPLGDKYAQYMVGYMHLTGMGAEKDAIVASAWYRLAAERGTPEFVSVRDQLLYNLKADERRRSDTIYDQLRREYTDLAVLLASIKRIQRALESRTGSRLSGGASSMTVIEMRPGPGSRSGVDYFGRLRQRMEQQLQRLSEIGDFPDLDTNPDKVNIYEIERMVSERIESVQD